MNRRTYVTQAEERFSIVQYYDERWCLHDSYLGWVSPHTDLDSALHAYIALVYYHAPQKLMPWFAQSGVRMLP